jgi:hypothetical protein
MTGNSVAVRNDAGAAGDDELRALAREWRRAVAGATDADDDSAAVVIVAVRDLASLSTVLAESAGRDGMPLSMVTRDLLRGPARYQALAMLAGAVWWFSRECGRPEAEVLDELAAARHGVEVFPEAMRDKAVRRAASDASRATSDSWAKVVAAVRELLSCVPAPGEGAGGQDTAAPGGPGALPAVTGLLQDSAWLDRYLTLAMLAGVVMRFSRECGRPETVILDGLAASLRPGA